MERPKNLISIPELKQLLVTISDNSLPACFRYRMMGELWQQSFLRVVRLADSSLVLFDEHKNNTIIISDIANVIQFEIDARVHQFEPHNHYTVQLSEHLV